MARETKEQREARLVAEEETRHKNALEYRKTIPAKLIELQGLAKECGVTTNVKLTTAGPMVEFYRFNPDHDDNDFEETLTYESSEANVSYVELQMKEFKEEIDAFNARYSLAQDTFNTLTREQKEAIREFIKVLL